MNFSTSHFNPSSYMLNNMPGVRRPELSSMTRPSYSINDLPTLSSRYVDELRSFNVKDYLPCPKDKLDVKLNYSYSDDFNSYLARDPQSARPGGNYSPNTYQPTSTCQLTSTYQPTSTCQLTSTYQPTSTCQLTSACQPTSMCNLSTCHTECRPTSCQPTSSTTSYRPSSMAVRRTLSSIEDRERGGNSKKQKTATGKNGKNPDLNNNFFKDARGKFGAVPERWADCQELARPKQLPCEYKDNRRSVYWMTRKPPPKGEGCNHTHFETSCRLDELAVPKVVCGEFCGTRHCCWECEYPQPPLSCIDPRSVDWNRLACPKKKYPPNGEEIQCVKRAALKALPTKRVCKLSEPKKVIDSDKFYLWLWRKKTDDEVILKKIRRLSIDKCDLSDIRVMIRLELSCTATEESCRNLKATIPTIKFALEKGAQSVVIICAYGTLNGKTDPEFSLQPLTEIFEKHLDRPVIYLEDCVGYQARSLCADPEPGSVFLLENLSFHREETGKFLASDGKEELCKPEDVAKFCSTLFNLGDVYVVDSITELVDMTNTTVGVKEQEKAYGFIIKSELQHYNRYVVNPVQPMVAIVGGKFKDKIKIVRNLMGKAKDIILGGELALIFLKAIKKIEIGNIEFTPKMLKKALKIYSRAKDTKTAIYLPSDVIVCHVKTGNFFTVLTREDIDEEYEVVDIGPFTRNCYQNVLVGAGTVVWNGHMGNLPDGTGVIAMAFAEATRNGALTYITDEETKDVFYCCGQSDVTHISANGKLTILLLNGKLPKGLAILNKYRKKIKKHLPIPVIPSNKPTVYDLPGMIIDSALRIKCINDVALEDKRVVIRVDFDLPNTKSATITNDYRIRMTIPTIKYALRNRAKTIVIMAHCGSPGGKTVPDLTLKPVCEALATLLGQTVLFIPETVGKPVETVLYQIHPGTVVMVENLRFNPGETGVGFSKPNLFRNQEQMTASPQLLAQFCEGITNLGDVYVDDAFACLHHDHSSMTGYLGNEKVCGFLVKNELKYMTKVFNNMKRKLLVVMGGLCSKSKLLMLLDLMKEADDIIIAGNLASLFLKIDLGMGIGRNSFDLGLESIARNIIDLAPYYKCKLHYPVDLWIANSDDGSNPQLHSITKPIPDGMTAVDVGDLSASMFTRIARKSNIILWSGTVGVSGPSSQFTKGTKKLLDTIKEVTSDPEKRAVSIVCGRSCSEFIQNYNPNHEGITHLSTGGASVLKLLTDRKLVALDILNCKPPSRLTNIMTADSGEYTDQRVLVKADLNLPLDETGQVQDMFPLRPLIPLIKMLQRKGARVITLIGYRGDPNGVPDEKFSLLPVKDALELVLDQPVVFVPEGVSDVADATIRSQEPGRVVLLENVRFVPEEIGVKELPGGFKMKISYDALNDFRNKLSSLGDVFINESFGSLRDTDSSTVGLKNRMKLAGVNLKKEVTRYMELRDTLEHPVVAVIGGVDSAKNVSRIFNMLHYVDELILCGSVAYAYFASEENVKLGQTAVNQACFKYFPKLIRKAKICGVPIHLPVDLTVAESLLPPPPVEVEEESNEEPAPNLPKTDIVTIAQGVPKTSHAFDIGPATILEFQQVIGRAKTIIYVGDAGAYDYEPFSQGTKAILSAVQAATNNGVVTVALGMKTGVCLGKLNSLDTFSHYSTSVETFTDIMMNRSLPGLAVLTASQDKKLKKLRIDQMELKGKRVLLRLDLDVPTVEGVVLDTDKLEEALPTIRYTLKMGAKCVVLLGHRGEPSGYKNYYLKMEPLVEELNQLLELKVTYIHRPCSIKARSLLADPPAGSVFLMENLKFYPAEYGRDAVTKVLDGTKEETEESHASPQPSPEIVQSKEAAPVEEEEEEDEDAESDDAILSVSDGDGGRNIDAAMFQKMALKSVVEFRDEISACGDVYINDDVKDVEQALTSLEGFGLEERGVGYLMMKYLMEADDSVYNFPGLVNLSPAPPS